MTTPHPGDNVHHVAPDGTCQPATILRTTHDHIALLRTPTHRPIAGPDPTRTPGTCHPEHP